MLSAPLTPAHPPHYYVTHNECTDIYYLQEKTERGFWRFVGDYDRLRDIERLADDEDAILDLETSFGNVERMREPA